MNAIIEFLEGRISCNGKVYDALAQREKEDFLKYEVAVIDLDLDANDPTIVDVFTRLNRTFYALSTIERFSTEYGSSEFMLVAKLLTGELGLGEEETDEGERALADPNVTSKFLRWAEKQQIGEIKSFFLNGRIFSPQETARMVHLMYVLNLMSTYVFGFYNRNDKAKDLLEEYAQSFPSKDEVVDVFERAAGLFNRLTSSKSSLWYNKSNAFSLFLAFAKNIRKAERLGPRGLRNKLAILENNLSPEYELAAREGVNNRKEREIRNDWIEGTVFE